MAKQKSLYKIEIYLQNHFEYVIFYEDIGDLAERFKATVLKTVVVNSYRGFESPSHLTLTVLLNTLSFDDKICRDEAL